MLRRKAWGLRPVSEYLRLQKLHGRVLDQRLPVATAGRRLLELWGTYSATYSCRRGPSGGASPQLLADLEFVCRLRGVCS